jgi:hypothetical protein
LERNYRLILLQREFQVAERNEMKMLKKWKKMVSQGEFRIMIREKRDCRKNNKNMD